MTALEFFLLVFTVAALGVSSALLLSMERYVLAALVFIVAVPTVVIMARDFTDSERERCAELGAVAVERFGGGWVCVEEVPG